MPCGVGFLASSNAKVLVEGSSSKTNSDCPRVFEGNNAAKFSGDNTGEKRIGIPKGLFERIAQYQSLHCGCNPQILLSDMREVILRGGSDQLIFLSSAAKKKIETGLAI